MSVTSEEPRGRQIPDRLTSPLRKALSSWELLLFSVTTADIVQLKTVQITFQHDFASFK